MGSTTLDYYDHNAEGFAAGTLDVKFTAIQDRFLGYLAPGALILDFGCGSGRDSRYFLSKGFKVEACDGSAQMVKIAEKTGVCADGEDRGEDSRDTRETDAV